MKLQKLGFKIYRHTKNISIAALVLGAAILFYGCENDIEKIKAFNSTDNLPIVEAQNFETIFTDSGQVRYTLKTPKLLRFENEGKAFLEFPEGVEITQFDATGKTVSSLTADYAKQFIKEERWEAKNNVVATNELGDTLLTEHLIWEEKNEKIYTEEFVIFIRPDQIITGIGFSSDASFKNYRIKDLKGTIYVTVDNKQKRKSNQPKKVEPNSSIKKIEPFNRPLQLEK
jgi:LPS export ABC transporter protein LptC